MRGATLANRRRPPTSLDLPIGRITLLFTDIEGSTRLLQRLGPRYPDLLASHHRLMRDAILAHFGIEVSTEGDSFFVVFRAVSDALGAAAQMQRTLAAAEWPDGAAVAVRMGIHTGEVELSDGEYVGLEVHRTARIAAAAHGGQVVISRASRELLGDELPPGASLRDLGEHRLKDLDDAQRLYQLVLDGLREEFPPLRSQSARFHLLPPELTSFIGRDAQAAAIAELLARTRLLTLTGPGGTGKTRLALHAARSCEGLYGDGVGFVELAAISDPDLVAPTIRHDLGFAEEVGRSALGTLVANLRERELLLALDNFEQVLPAADVVAQLMAGTERLTVLVTSRAALRITGEQEYPVPPLVLPDATGPLDAETVSRSEAVRLFVDRARLIRPDFALDASNVRAIVEICARLDGLPLAIELAASRIKLLPPDALLARLDRRLDVLRTTTADRDDRQRTLRGAIEWSHDLLAAEERTVFRRMAIFVGGASLDAAEALVPGSGPEADGQAVDDTLGLLAALVDHSLVRQEERAGEPRLMMLETIREYGLECLAEAGERDGMAERHARWYVGLVQRLAPTFTAGPQALDAVQAEHDNIRAALRWALDHGEAELAQVGVGALWRFWHLRGHLAEGQDICAEVVAMPGAEAFLAARARALYALASVRYWRSDHAGAHRDFDASLAAAREAGDRDAEAEALYALGFAHDLSQHWEAAREAFRASGAIYDELGARVGSLNSRFGLAFTDSLAGSWEAAAAAIEGIIPEFDALGMGWQASNSRLVLGRTLQRLGQLERAELLMRDGLARSQAIGDRTMVAMTLWDLGSIVGQRGDHERSLRLAGAAQGIELELGAGAPRQLINSLDPVEMAGAAGVEAQRIEDLLDEGRRLDEAAAVALALGQVAPGGYS